jgi:SAM-dependent methyltransferase
MIYQRGDLSGVRFSTRALNVRGQPMLDWAKAVLRRVAPWIVTLHRERKLRSTAHADEGSTTSEIFENVYRRNLWGGSPGEFYSGPGSDLEPSRHWVSTVNRYIDANQITSVVDLGCGDFRVSSQIARPGVDYIGCDVVKAMIADHNATKARPGLAFQVCDMVEDDLPVGQLYLIRQVLQHLSNQQISVVLKKLEGKQHVIVAEHHPSPSRFKGYNLDKPAGAGIRIPFGSGAYLDKPPFSAPYDVAEKTAIPPVINDGEHLTIYVKRAGI